MMNKSKMQETNLDVRKSKLLADIHCAAQANHLRLQHVELAVAHLTSICIALRDDKRLLALCNCQQGRSGREGESKGSMEMSLSAFSSSSTSPSSSGFEVHATNKYAGCSKTSPRPPTKPVTKNMLPTKNKGRSTASAVQNSELTRGKISKNVKPTQNNGTIKLATNKNLETGKDRGHAKTATAMKIPGRSAPAAVVKNMKTTTAKVSMELALRNKEKTRATVVAETSRVRSSVKSTMKAVGIGQGQKTRVVAMSHAQEDRVMVQAQKQAPAHPGGVISSSVRPRRKWNTARKVGSLI